MKNIKLIDLVHWQANLIEYDSIATAGRTDKITIKTMFEHNKNVRELTHPNENEYNYVLQEFIKEKGLEQWAKIKGYYKEI